MGQLTLDFSRHSALLSPDEIFDVVDASLLRKLQEDKRLERKPPGMHARELGEYFSMWSNTLPDGGLLVVGMENDGRFSGCHKLSAAKLNELEKCYQTYCPDSRAISKRVDVTAAGGERSFVVIFRVHYREDKVVRTVSDEAFTRIGDSKHRLTDAEVHELEIDKHQVDIEKEPITLQYPDDFDLDLIHRFLEGSKKSHQAEQEHTDIEVLKYRRLGKIQDGHFVPNTACALVFSNDPAEHFPGCYIKFLRVDGEIEQSGDRYNVVKTENIEGSIPRLIEKCSAFVASQLREFSILGDDGKFYSAPEYPQDAWVEAIVNACVHRSYGLKNMNVTIKMFDDKLVIESPGGFPPTVTPENIYTNHHPRNPTLMRALWYLGVVKEHAEGTKRMRDTMQKSKLPPPMFEQIAAGGVNAFVRVTLRNNYKQRRAWVDRDVVNVLGEALSKNLSSDEKRILNFVAENGKINVTQCLKLLPSVAKWHGAKRILMKLVSRGLLEQVHSPTVHRDSRSYYVLPSTFSDKETAHH